MLKNKFRYLTIILLFFVSFTNIAFASTCSPPTNTGAGGSAGTGGAPNTAGGQGGQGQCDTQSNLASGGSGGGGGGGSGAGGSGAAGAGGGVLLKTTSGTVSITGSIDTRGGNSSTTNGGTVKIFNTGGCTDATNISSGRLYITGGNCPPSAPTLLYPVSASNGNSVFTTFKLRSSDYEGDYLQYWIDVCSDSSCISVIRSICQVATGTGVPGTCTPSQVGWSSQDTQSGTAYTSNSTLTLSTIATLNYQPPLLDANTQYWWRGYAIDPGGSNTWSAASPISTFNTAPTETHVQGNVQFQGNVQL